MFSANKIEGSFVIWLKTSFEFACKIFIVCADAFCICSQGKFAGFLC